MARDNTGAAVMSLRGRMVAARDYSRATPSAQKNLASAQPFVVGVEKARELSALYQFQPE